MKKWMTGVVVLMLTVALFAGCAKNTKTTTNNATNNTTTKSEPTSKDSTPTNNAPVDNTVNVDPLDEDIDIPTGEIDEAAAIANVERAMNTYLEEAYGDKVVMFDVHVDKIYSAAEMQEEPLKSLNLGENEVAFDVSYDLYPAEGVDPIEFTAGSGYYDEDYGCVTDKHGVGVLRYDPSRDMAYYIDNFGTGF